MDYNDIKKTIEEMPQTWFPALLKLMVEKSYEKEVWNDRGGCSSFVSKMEAKISYTPPPEDDHKVLLTCSFCYKTFVMTVSDIHTTCHSCAEGTLHKIPE